MPWKLEQWKRCDGGCARRAPRFPNDELNQYRSGDRHQTSEPAGTNPDGGEWEGGNSLHAELWALYEAKDRNTNRIKLSDIDALPGLSAIRALDWPKQGPWKGQPLQWFLDTDFGWPVRGPHVQKILDRFAALGLWNPTLYSTGINYDTIYGDDEATEFATHFDGIQVSIRGQSFHVRHDITDAVRDAIDAPCCHRWSRV